jgi:hypothetical protein
MRGSPDVLADLRLRGAAAGLEFVDGAFGSSGGGSLQAEIRAQMALTPGPVLADLYESMYLAPGSIGPRVGTRAFLAGLGKPCLSLYSSENAANFARSLDWPTGSAMRSGQAPATTSTSSIQTASPTSYEPG